MVETEISVLPFTDLPDHTQLPESDGTFVKNFQEHPQSIILTDSILPVLQARHPDSQFCIGQDCGIYWNLRASLSERPTRGAISPDWFYVPGVPPLLNNQMRRSYVMWQEAIAPLIVLEFVSGDGSEERDRTPVTGKFWIYEQVLRVPFYAIYEVMRARVEVYHMVDGHYELALPNEQGHYAIGLLGVELGIWQGSYGNIELPWLRWWDSEGNLLFTGDERAEQERQRAEQADERAEQERQRAEQADERAEQERQRADRLAERLRSMGIDPDAL